MNYLYRIVFVLIFMEKHFFLVFSRVFELNILQFYDAIDSFEESFIEV